MNIYVCLKQVPDTEASILVKGGNAINEAAIKWIVSPYDEYAIEEALKLKEKTPGATVTAVCLGPERVQNALRTALAMGADQAIHVESGVYLDDQNTARALAAAIKADPAFGVIFTGKQAIDNDSNQVHILLAESLDVPVATNVTVFAVDGQKVKVQREIDEGAKEMIEMSVPCVVAAAKGLNTPRYASMMGIMKAKKIEIKKITLNEIGIDESQNKIHLLKLSAPAEKPQGRIIPGEAADAVRELARLLREEAKVI
ncbi:MAG: electron transfer flavoprotein subunit beta/FixA family protein [Candidatus Aminicenantes bacterium]|nr:electron transfer flavoprotein subunit beta/FixA family protein [Candidatus Aminicenantes bacterium]